MCKQFREEVEGKAAISANYTSAHCSYIGQSEEIVMFREASSENLEVMHWVVHNSCGRLAAVSVSPIRGYTHLNPSRKGARVGVKFGDTVAGVRLREPPRDRHHMRIPSWHRRLHSGAGGDIEANQKCKNALHSGSISKTRPIIVHGGDSKVVGSIIDLVVPTPRSFATPTVLMCA